MKKFITAYKILNNNNNNNTHRKCLSISNTNTTRNLYKKTKNRLIKLHDVLLSIFSNTYIYIYISTLNSTHNKLVSKRRFYVLYVLYTNICFSMCRGKNVLKKKINYSLIGTGLPQYNFKHIIAINTNIIGPILIFFFSFCFFTWICFFLANFHFVKYAKSKR